MKNRRQARRGFTLLEVLLVLAILGVIAAMVVPNLLGQFKASKIKAAKATVKALESTLKLYAANYDGEFPEGDQDALALLLQETVQDGRTIEALLERPPLDPWGQLLYYQYPNEKAPGSTLPAIWSSGPDKKNDDGEGDDVNNWDDLGF